MEEANLNLSPQPHPFSDSIDDKARGSAKNGTTNCLLGEGGWDGTCEMAIK